MFQNPVKIGYMLNGKRKILIAVVLASFALSLAYSVYFNIEPSVDAAAYDRIAWNLVQGNGYKEFVDLSYDEDIAILRVGPGYEFFLALIYYIFGHNIWVVLIINALLNALSTLLVFLLSYEVFRGSWKFLTGIIAASFIAFSPDLITINGMLMTETLGVFLIILSVYLFFKFLNNDAKPLYLILPTALVFGFAVLVRTPAALLFLPFAGYLIANKNWKAFFVLSFTLFLIFTPWVVRNYQVYNTLIPTNLAFGYDLLAGNHPGATGELEPYYLNEEFMGSGRIEGNKLALKEALVFIFTNPLEFLKITFYRASIYFSFARPTGFWFHLDGASKAITLITSAIYSILLFVFGFFGIYKAKYLPDKDKKRAKFLFWLLLMMPLAIIAIIVETRYRFLVYPFFAIFAGFGLSNIFNGKIDWKVIFTICGILFLNTAFDALRNLDRIIERVNNFL